MTDRVILDCPNVERCGGQITFVTWTEDDGDLLHAASTTWVAEVGKTCRCDLEPEQWDALEDAAAKELSRA